MLTDTSSFAQFQSRRDSVTDNGVGLENGSAAAEMVVRNASMETIMDHPTVFARAARKVARQTRRRRKMKRQEVAQVFFQSGLLDMLGYGGPEYRINDCLDEECVNVVMRSFTGRPIAVLSFREPDEDLAASIDELEQVAFEVLGSTMGLAGVTNGSELWLYRMHEGVLLRPGEQFDLAAMTTDCIRALLTFFQHCQVCWPRHLRSPRFW